uniref:Cytochrome c oxidase subunit 3 n=1 Tax=Pleurostomum flabellatum TaxID=405751 RepID=A0A7T0M422_9EUKA|nr:cytochrome c oxidase subunit 3 [Pleurostomum flabellatum]QPL15603.1 cytochrome c oxidase subunit 3 [Pleurostomum flabellatum]
MNFTNSINFWQNYLNKDVSYMRRNRVVHYFNDIAYTPWPFHLSFCMFLFCFFGVLFLHHFEWAGTAIVLSLSLIFLFVFFWSKDLHFDSAFFGKFNYKVRRSILSGFLLFLLSEICIFAGFLWTYFDRYFHSPGYMGGTFLPLGIETVSWNGYPLWGSFVLLASGWGCNQAYYAARGGSWSLFRLWSSIGHILGGMFLLNIQVQEYFSGNTLSISDSVLGSCFYLITGFHGLHVCIGLLLLTFVSDLIQNYSVTRDRIFSYSIALIYWHFVDWIWLFVYTFLYVLNGNAFIEI